MNIVSKIMGVPVFGRFMLDRLKKTAFLPFQVPLEKALEKQTRLLSSKFARMENTEIGSKLGVRARIDLEKIPITNYEFYAPFYNHPSEAAFMYPLQDYARIRTSGTTGKEKWFLIPRKAMRMVLRESALPAVFALFHDEEKITLEYGDTMYFNMGPAPFISGSMFNMGSSEKQAPFLILVPNINLSYKEKVDYFILNREKINAAWLLASTLVTKIMPATSEPLKLKGLMLIDDLVARAYKEKITKFCGVPPKTLYASTETVGPTIPSVQHSMGFIFDPRRGFFEFVPVKNSQDYWEKTVGLDEVKVGGTYRLVYTDFIGELSRYDTANSFKCVAKGDDIICSDFPVFEFYSRLDKAIAIMNFTRINEKELTDAFKGAGIQIADFTARADREGGYEYLHIYVELVSKKNAEDVEKKVHKQLYSMDNDYKMLVDFFGYNPIKVELLPNGIFNKYLESKSGAYPKVCRINMDKREFTDFLSLLKTDNQ